MPPPSDHFDGRRFFNPHSHNRQHFTDVPRMLRTPRQPWPARVAVTPQVPPAPASATEIVVTYVGHATTIVQMGGATVLTDPVYSERASPVSWAGPKRVRQPGVAFDDIPRVDVVLISH